MSVKVQAKVNSSVDLLALEEDLYRQWRERVSERERLEEEAWERVKPLYESQQAMRASVEAEMER